MSTEPPIKDRILKARETVTKKNIHSMKAMRKFTLYIYINIYIYIYICKYIYINIYRFLFNVFSNIFVYTSNTK